MKYVCPRCQRCFARSEHLQRHERSHTKEKPFSCNKCSNAFTRKDLLVRHLRLHHPNEEASSKHESCYKSTNHPQRASDTAVGVAHANEQFTSTFSMNRVDEDLNDVVPLVNFELSSYNMWETVPPADTAVEIAFPVHIDRSSNATTFYSSPQEVDFSSFLDTIDHPSGPYSSVYQPLPYHEPSQASVPSPVLHESGVRYPIGGEIQYGRRLTPSKLASIPLDISSQFGVPTICNRTTTFTSKPVFKVDEKCRDSLLVRLRKYESVLPNGYKMPSKHTLNRLVHAWLTCFNNHYPMFHLPTLDLCKISPELLLAITALGSQYCQERKTGRQLFELSKAICLERLHPTRLSSEKTHNPSNMRQRKTSGSHSDRTTDHISDSDTLFETAQALVLLIALSMWSQSEPSLRESLFLRSSLQVLLDDDALRCGSFPLDNDWHSWIRYETIKRTKLISFCFLNLFTIIYDMAPVLFYKSVNLNLPCSEREWKATCLADLIHLRGQDNEEVAFQDALLCLLGSNKAAQNLPSSTSFGNYALIHAIIQHVWLYQQAGHALLHSDSLQRDASGAERGLKMWQECWKRDRESSTDPSNPEGPLSFTSLALLRMAYIRVTTGSVYSNALNIWDPERIAKSLYNTPSLQRSDRLTLVALHCAKALAIPITMGLNFVVQTQVFYWSNQYALCSLECVLLLSKWLEMVTIPDLDPPRNRKEQKVLDFILQVVGETEYEGTKEDLLRAKTLSVLVVRLWAKLFKPDCVWDLIGLIGYALEAYADILDSEN